MSCSGLATVGHGWTSPERLQDNKMFHNSELWMAIVFVASVTLAQAASRPPHLARHSWCGKCKGSLWQDPNVPCEIDPTAGLLSHLGESQYCSKTATQYWIPLCKAYCTVWGSLPRPQLSSRPPTHVCWPGWHSRLWLARCWTMRTCWTGASLSKGLSCHAYLLTVRDQQVTLHILLCSRSQGWKLRRNPSCFGFLWNSNLKNKSTDTDSRELTGFFTWINLIFSTATLKLDLKG